VTHAPLIHGTPDAAFIYPLAQDANAQVPLAVGLSVRHYSELSDVEHVFLCWGLMPRRYRCARLEEAHRNRRPRNFEGLQRFLITVETLDKERRLLRNISLAQTLTSLRIDSP
jgi:hypothetical protein